MLPEDEKSYSARVLQTLMRSLHVLGPVFDDPQINEIMINGPFDVYVRGRGADEKLDVNLTAGAIKTAIQLLASMHNKVVDEDSRVISARLPGFRVEACLPPLAVKGPSMCIRRHATRVLTMEDYMDSGTITLQQAKVIQELVDERHNFLIAGGTYSGKTTLMNCVLSLIDPKHRLFVIEQVHELKIAAPNHVLVECDPDYGFDSRKAVRMGMRYSPDRVFLGELRGPEAYDWIDAANTGHPGSGATIHANSAFDALARLETLLTMASSGMPFEVIQQRVASTVQYVLFIEQANAVRKLSQICRVDGYDRSTGKYQTTSLPLSIGEKP